MGNNGGGSDIICCLTLEGRTQLLDSLDSYQIEYWNINPILFGKITLNNNNKNIYVPVT